MNKRLGKLVAAMAVLVVGGVLFLVGRSMWEQRKRDLVERTLKMLPGVSQHIQNFRRVKMEDGKKVWEVAATDARYFEDQSLIVVRDPVVAWYLQDGREVGMRGQEGRLRLSDHEIERVELQGPIEVSLADYKLRTDDAVYNQDIGLISSPNRVQITGEAMDLQGDGMEVDVRTQRVRLLHNVAMRLEPAQIP